MGQKRRREPTGFRERNQLIVKISRKNFSHNQNITIKYWTNRPKIRSFYKDQGYRSVRLAIELSRPYLQDQDYGVYLQRFDTVSDYHSGPKFIFSGPDDSYSRILEALKKGFSWTKFEHCTSKILRILISLRRTRRYVRGSFRVRDACSVLASCSLGDFDDTL